MMSSLGIMGKTTSLLGPKNIVSSWNFAHWLETSISTTYIPFFEKFCFCGYFSKNIFLKFSGSKKQNFKIRDSNFVDLSCLCILHFLFAFGFKIPFLVKFQTFTLIGQNRVKWRHLSRPIAKTFWPILICFARDDAKLMSGEVCKVSCQYSTRWRSYSWKTEEGVGSDPPRRWLVKFG